MRPQEHKQSGTLSRADVGGRGTKALPRSYAEYCFMGDAAGLWIILPDRKDSHRHLCRKKIEWARHAIRT